MIIITLENNIFIKLPKEKLTWSLRDKFTGFFSINIHHPRKIKYRTPVFTTCHEPFISHFNNQEILNRDLKEIKIKQLVNILHRNILTSFIPPMPTKSHQIKTNRIKTKIIQDF